MERAKGPDSSLPRTADRPADAAFALESVAHAYRTGFLMRPTQALAGVSLALARGQFLGLVGANGSGKSTLLRLLAGVERPDRGSARVFGLPAHRSAARARVGFTPEGTPWPLDLGLGAGLRLLLAMRGYRRADRARRADHALERLGLADESRRTLGRCSSGQRRRFGLAQCLAHDPDLILLDEPTVGLDAWALEALGDWLEDAHRRGASAVIASHLPGDLLGRCERLALLSRGQLAASGTTAQLAADARRIDVQVEFEGAADLAALTRAAADVGAHIRAARPAAAGLLALEARVAGAVVRDQSGPRETARDGSETRDQGDHGDNSDHGDQGDHSDHSDHRARADDPPSRRAP